jgi:hypothetical protein
LKCPIGVLKFSKKSKTLDSSTVHSFKNSKFSQIVLFYESDAKHYWFEVERRYENEFEILAVSKDDNQNCELLCYKTDKTDQESKELNQFGNHIITF